MYPPKKTASKTLLWHPPLPLPLFSNAIKLKRCLCTRLSKMTLQNKDTHMLEVKTVFLTHWIMLQDDGYSKIFKLYQIRLSCKLQPQNKFLTKSEKREKEVFTTFNSEHLYAHIHLTEISSENVPYLNSYYNLHLITLSSFNEFEAAKWYWPLIKKI